MGIDVLDVDVAEHICCLTSGNVNVDVVAQNYVSAPYDKNEGSPVIVVNKPEIFKQVEVLLADYINSIRISIFGLVKKMPEDNDLNTEINF